jgi:hypothetical protein
MNVNTVDAAKTGIPADYTLTDQSTLIMTRIECLTPTQV